MHLEDYFDFQAENDIRIKGHRIGIEIILFDYLDGGMSAEEIVLHYPSLAPEEVYATLTYYWANQEKVEAYLQAVKNHEARMRAEQARNPSPGVKRMRELMAKRHQQAASNNN